MTKRGETKNKTNNSSFDGFANINAKLGIGPRNLLSGGHYIQTKKTNNRLELEAMYRTSWVVGAIIDAVAEDMTRSGISISGSIEPDRMAKIQKNITRFGIWRAILDAIKWGRLYGGAIAAFVIDGQDPSTPLNIETISKNQFKGLMVYDRWAIQPSTESLITYGMNVGLPEFYTLIGNGNTGTLSNIKWHHSRIIRFIGTQLPIWQASTNEMWGASVIERLYDRLVSFDSATMGAANLVQKAHLRTLQINNLREIFAQSKDGSPAEQNLLTMIENMRYLQSNEGITLLDKDDTFATHQYSFSGLPEIILQFGQQIAGAEGIPLVRLFGQSPAGLNSTGENDLRMYYDNILARQESRLREGLTMVLQILHRSLFGESAPDDFDFDFTPLWQTSAKEKADIATVTTAAIIQAYDAGIIDQVTALKELKQMSDNTGVFSNITQKTIQEAEMVPPPIPVETATQEQIKEMPKESMPPVE